VKQFVDVSGQQITANSKQEVADGLDGIEAFFVHRFPQIGRIVVSALGTYDGVSD
jgi:hypothetical protein